LYFCKIFVKNRHELLYHYHSTHPQFGRGQLQKYPWDRTEDSPFNEFENAEEMMALYIKNRQFILHPHMEDSDVKRIYNFPIAGSVSSEDIKNNLETIYQKQSKTFKVNVTAGLILENISDGTLRYFTPGSNMFLLEYPAPVTNIKTLEKTVKKLQDEALIEKIRYMRPNSNYRVKYVPQLSYYVYLSEFPLGATVKIPDFIKNNRSVHTYSVNMKTNLCFFYALAQQMKIENKQTQVKHVVKLQNFLFDKWIWFLFKQGLSRTPKQSKEKYAGVKLSDMPLLEDCFDCSIHIYELLPDKSSSRRFTSLKQRE